MKNMKQLLLIVPFFLLYHLLIYYIGWNSYIFLHTIYPNISSTLLIIILLICAYSFLFSHLFKSITIFKVISAYWFAVLQYAILILPVANLVCYLLFFYIDEPHSILFVGSCTFFLFVCIFFYGTYNAYSPIIREYNLTLPKKNGKREQLSIAIASDMHFGTLSGNAHLAKLVTMINNLKADLILLPGDIIDDDPNPFLQKHMGEKMKELQAPLGIYGVLGNHEYYGKKIPEFLQEMERIGIQILMDESIIIDDSFELIGRKDKTDKNRLSISQLTTNNAKDLPLIMMDHQPAELTQAMENDIHLILSGHTHRGQMAPNHFITKRVFELDWGYKQKEQLHAIVSSGYGFWGPPLRLGSRSEVVYIKINFIS
ncbi:metallophosphoesterase [Niallia nealsonii]|uniref:Phosphoesterase n=1 Tax=Niallia nealsonii TaxID=115979 RepID=A0A2N0YWZ4_9BACI|nr:metallophosphoesterase [Niallia nealsonii]PKG21772.1 phosphoesterase [Niallia nealsonii]